MQFKLRLKHGMQKTFNYYVRDKKPLPNLQQRGN